MRSIAAEVGVDIGAYDNQKPQEKTLRRTKLSCEI